MLVDVRDRGFRRRAALAFAAAVALHGLAAALFPLRSRPEPAQDVVAVRMLAITRRPPRPTPAPLATPARVPRATAPPRTTLVPQVAVRAPAAKAAAATRARPGGAAARKHVTRRRLRPSQEPPPSLADGSGPGLQDGGRGAGAGPGSGAGGLQGSDSGVGGNGSGSGTAANGAPCGIVYLLPGPTSRRADGSVEQVVLAKVVLGDGNVDVGRFPYPFVYPSSASDPFLEQAGADGDAPIPIQEPPPGLDLSDAPEAVHIVLKYSEPRSGLTSLNACPNPS
jgi:hypothetical protein